MKKLTKADNNKKKAEVPPRESVDKRPIYQSANFVKEQNKSRIIELRGLPLNALLTSFSHY